MTLSPPQSASPDLIKQIGTTHKHREQLHQRQRRLRLAVLVARERTDAAAEDFGGLALVESKLLTRW